MDEFLKKIKLKKWLIFLGMLSLFLFLDVVIAIIYYFFGKDLNNLSFLDTMSILLIKYIVLILTITLLYRKYLYQKWFDFIRNFKTYFKISFRDWLLGFIIMVISNLIISYFITGLGQNEQSVQMIIKKTPALALIITTFLAPFVEEIVFRKSLQDCFNNKTIYIILSGLLFGLVHVFGSSNAYEYLLIIPYGALGLMFAKTVSETNNIYCSIMMHMLHNFFLTLIAIGGL